MSAARPLAFLFPGQGSQTRGMKDIAVRYCPELVRSASELVGADPFEHVSEGTRFAQPAIFCVNVAGWRALGSANEDVATLAGHSLGEFAALVAAGALDAEEALKLVVVRGRLMQEAGERAGGMLAISGQSPEEAMQTLRDLDVVIANYNSPTQIVISGPVECIEEAGRRLKESEVRAARLPVSGAFHSRLMEPILPRFQAAVAEASFNFTADPRVICSTTCAPFADVPSDLVGGLVRPVRWHQTVKAIRDRGISRFIEVGPGRVLSRLLVRAYGDAVSAVSVSEMELANV